jgi:RimJ/RimL family protein N-acetyltransferase
VAATLSPTGRPPAPGGSPQELTLKAAHWRQFGFGLWLLRDRFSGAVVGRGGLQRTIIEAANEVEIAWAIVPDRWRQGLATELARACIEIARHDLALPHVIAYTRTDNIASRGVMLSFRTSRASFLPPPLGSLSGSDRERFEFAYEVV